MPTTIKHTIDAFTNGDYLDEVKIGNVIELNKRRGRTAITRRARRSTRRRSSTSRAAAARD
jgi:hypothetical protein